MDIHQVRELLQRYQAGDCTSFEKELIEKWYQRLIDAGEWQWEDGEKELMSQILEGRIMKQIDDLSGKEKSSFSLLLSFRWWAAASVILVLGAFGYFMFFNKTPKENGVVKVLSNDIKAPQSNRAMITLSNGQKVYLDSAGNGAFAMQGNVKLMKLAGGEIAYQQGTNQIIGEVQYNILSNPKGSKVINMLLADGSKVWLNAGSSLLYPVSFISDERKVSVTGEAYFEVAHNVSRPFIVNHGSMEVRVLGTHFNVNAFEDDDSNIKVTLLEGSVKIDNGNAANFLKPGQQALVSKEIKLVNDVNLDLVMAWKNGYFQFDRASLQNVLNQVSRWYDVDVVYEGKNQPRQFVGEIQRDLNLSEMLKLLKINKVNFKIEGKNLSILAD